MTLLKTIMLHNALSLQSKLRVHFHVVIIFLTVGKLIDLSLSGFQMFIFLLFGVAPKTRVIAKLSSPCPCCHATSTSIQRIDDKFHLFFIPIATIKQGEQYLFCSTCRWAGPTSRTQQHISRYTPTPPITTTQNTQQPITTTQHLQPNSASLHSTATTTTTTTSTVHNSGSDTKLDTCNHCGRVVAHGYRFCPYCGVEQLNKT